MDENKDLAVVEQMNELANTDTTEVAAARVISPIEKVEESLSDFSQDVFKLVKDEFDFQKSIEAEILNRLSLEDKDGGFSAGQLLMLHNNTSVSLNDRIAKSLGPTFQLMTAKQQAEIAAKAATERAAVQIQMNAGTSDVGMRSLNESRGVDQEILQGMRGIQDLLQAFASVSKQQKSENPNNNQ